MRNNPRVNVAAEVMAKNLWLRHVEDEQSKTDYPVDIPDWDDLPDSRQRYLTNESYVTALRVVRAIDAFDSTATEEAAHE